MYIKYICLIIIFLIFTYLIKKKENFKNIKNKKAVVVLTRGYKNKNQYKNLLDRNKYLEKFYDKNLDYIIFHEGNITKEHQKYIQNNTKIPLIFINVSKSFKKDKVNFYPPTKRFNLGYRNMCNFWFCEFWKYVQEYDKIIRIDEDCNYYTNYNDIFKLLHNKVAIYGNWANDAKFVTEGLNNFTINFLKKKGIKYKTRSPSGPYTNVIGLNLNLCRKNKLLSQYISDIKESNKIYIYRWGDLPLWGEALKYLFKPEEYTLNKNIKYFHKSHNSKIN